MGTYSAQASLISTWFMSEALAALFSRISFEGCFYREQPSETEIVSPSGATERLA